MKYCAEVLDFFAEHPNREFRMKELIHVVTGGVEITRKERNAVRQGVMRVLDVLEECGQVVKRQVHVNFILYQYKSETEQVNGSA